MPRSTAQEAALKRQQILEAAIQRFARDSYEGTSLRAIAADVGVDVAHVHRSFGSKELLLAEALRTTGQPERYLAGPRSLLASRLSTEILAGQSKHDDGEPGTFDIIVRSLSSHDASKVLHDTVLADFIGPISGMISPPSARRAGLIAAFLLGIGVFRDVLAVEPLLDDGDGELRQLIVQVLQILIGSGRQDASLREPGDDNR